MEETNQKNPDTAAPAEKKKKGAGMKKLLIPLLFAIVIAGCCTGYYFYSSSANYFKTDNARVTAKMYSVLPVTSGRLLSWNVETGDLVEKNQVLGRQEVLPYITSPISGTVVKNDGAVNQMAAAGSTLAIIADTSDLYIGVNVEETDIVKVHTGEKADVYIDAYPDRTFHGQVTEIDQATQTYFSSGMSSFSTSGTYTKVTQLVPVKVTIDNEENLPLAFGMNATVRIHLK